MKVKAKDLKKGMMVDLECDPYADPDGDDPIYECEFQVVESVERETPDCVLIHFDNCAIGFPIDHELMVEMLRPACRFCESGAEYLAARSVDLGETVEWMPICGFHADGWNEGGDWQAPVYPLGKGELK